MLRVPGHVIAAATDVDFNFYREHNATVELGWLTVFTPRARERGYNVNRTFHLSIEECRALAVETPETSEYYSICAGNRYPVVCLEWNGTIGTTQSERSETRIPAGASGYSSLMNI